MQTDHVNNASTLLKGGLAIFGVLQDYYQQLAIPVKFSDILLLFLV